MERNNINDIEGSNISSIFALMDSIVYIADIRTHKILYANEHARKIIRAGRETGNMFRIPVKASMQSKCSDLFLGKTVSPSYCVKCRYFDMQQTDSLECFEPHVSKYRDIRAIPRLKSNRHVGLHCSVKDIISQKKTERELKKANRMFKTSSECNSALLQIQEEKELLAEICRIIVETGGYRLAWAGFIESYEDRKIGVAAHAGVSNNYIDIMSGASDTPGADKSPQWLAIESGEPSIARDLKSIVGPGLWHSEAVKRGFNALLAIPLYSGESVSGVLTICASEADAFDGDEITLYTKFSQNLNCHLTQIRSHTERETVRAEELRAGHLASLGELAAGVAHEINNPINGIINYAQMLINAGKPDTRELDIAGRIIRESERVAVIVRSLLSFAPQRDAGKVPTNVRDLLLSSMALTETQLINDGITVTMEIPRLLPVVSAQPQNLEQVFLNIISNARYALNQKYDGKHENKLFAIGVAARTHNKSHFLDITFYDSGIGIPANIINKVVNPFFSTKPSNMGTGLGLSISYGIIRDHDGKLIIDSVEGEYTQVRIELPVLMKSDMKMY